MNTSYNYADFIGLNLASTTESKDSDYEMEPTIHPDTENSSDNIAPLALDSSENRLATTRPSS